METRRVPDEPRFTVDVRTSGSTATVVVAGELDFARSGEFRTAVQEHLHYGRIVLDLRDLTFMDSSGIAALDSMQSQAALSGAELVVCSSIPSPVERVLQLTGMISVLRLIDCEETP